MISSSFRTSKLSRISIIIIRLLFFSYSVGILLIYVSNVPLQNLIFALSAFLIIFLLFISKNIKFLISSIPIYALFVFFLQLPILSIRDDWFRAALNLFSFFIGVLIYSFLGKVFYQNEKAHRILLNFFIIANSLPLLFGILGWALRFDNSISFFLSNPFVNKLILYSADNAGHQTAGVAFAFLLFSYILITQIKPNLFKFTYTNLLSKQIPLAILIVLATIIAIATQRRLGLFYIFSFFYFITTFDTILFVKNYIIQRKLAVAFMLLIVLIPILTLNYQDLFELYLSIIQERISSLVGFPIRLINQEQYSLFSGREQLWSIHMSILREYPFFGAGYPLPLLEFGWLPGDASSESGTTSILARFGWFGGILFFFPFFKILINFFSRDTLKYVPGYLVFTFFSIIFSCFYNGNLQNTYGAATFDWIMLFFILAFTEDIVQRTKSRV